MSFCGICDFFSFLRRCFPCGLNRQVGEKYFEEHMDYPQAEYIDLFNLIEKLRGDIEILKQEIDGGDDEAAEEEDIEDIEE